MFGGAPKYLRVEISWRVFGADSEFSSFRGKRRKEDAQMGGETNRANVPSLRSTEN